MKNRILIIENESGSKCFLGMECNDGSVINLNDLSKGIIQRHFDIKDDEKHDVLIEDITDF